MDNTFDVADPQVDPRIDRALARAELLLEELEEIAGQNKAAFTGLSDEVARESQNGGKDKDQLWKSKRGPRIYAIFKNSNKTVEAARTLIAELTRRRSGQ